MAFSCAACASVCVAQLDQTRYELAAADQTRAACKSDSVLMLTLSKTRTNEGTLSLLMRSMHTVTREAHRCLCPDLAEVPAGRAAGDSEGWSVGICAACGLVPSMMNGGLMLGSPAAPGTW